MKRDSPSGAKRRTGDGQRGPQCATVASGGPLVRSACANGMLLLRAARSVGPRQTWTRKTSWARWDTEGGGRGGGEQSVGSPGPCALATTRRRVLRAWIARSRHSEGLRRRAQLVAEGIVVARWAGEADGWGRSPERPCRPRLEGELRVGVSDWSCRALTAGGREKAAWRGQWN